MFGISFYELIIVFIILVILFKPKEIISILFNLGKIIRNIKYFCANVQNKFEELTLLGNPDDYFLKKQKNSSKNTQTAKKDTDRNN